MKKLLYAFLALLFLSGVSFAANIDSSIEPKEGGPELWVTSVFNNSGGTLDVGDVVVSDVDASTGDDDNWVTTTTTADTYLVMGVVIGNDIVDQDNGTIAIRGPVAVDVLGSGLGVVDQLACSSGTAGSAWNCATAAANFGWVTQAASSNSAIVCVNCGF